MLRHPLFAALACLLAAPAALAQDCAAETAAARAACGGSNDPGQCVLENMPAACAPALQAADATTLDRITVLGTGYALDVARYPGSASVVLPQEMDFSVDIIQSLARVPGFDSGNDSGRGLGQSFSIRGWGHGNEDRVILMLDGVRRSANLFANQSSSFGMESDLIKQVEVIRGSSSIHHGGGAIGGVVNAVTRDAEDFMRGDSEVGGMFKLRYDSNNAREAGGAFAWAPSDRPVDLVVFAKRQERGDIDLPETVTPSTGDPYDSIDNDEEIDTLFVKLGWEPADGHRLTLSHFAYDMAVETTWNSLFHAGYADDLGPVVGDRRQHDTVLRYVASPAGSRWLDLAATAYDTRADYSRGYKYGAEYGSDLYYRNQDERRGASVQNLMRFDGAGASHRLLLGADYEVRKEDGIYILNGERDDFNSMPNEWKDLGVFAQYEGSWLDDRLVLQFGGRYDRFDREVQGVSENYDNSRFSPRAGASFELLPGLNLLANYAETFRAPTPHETSSAGALNPYYWYQPNPDLQAETSREREFGFSWRRHGLFSGDDALNLKAMHFSGRIEDMIDLVIDYGSVSPEGSEYVQYRNVGEVKRHGVELEGSYDLGAWGGYLSYETLDQYDAQTREKTPWAFADRIRGGLRWRPHDDLELSASVTHWFAPDQNPEGLVSGGEYLRYVDKSYSRTDLQARWQPASTGIGFLDDGTEVLFGVNNLFDQRRLNPSNVATSGRIGVGRNVYLSLSRKF